MNQRDAIDKAIREHIADSGIVNAPHRLLDRICEALGLVEQLDYEGWRIVKTIGSEMKCGVRGAARFAHGYIATNIKTGVEEVCPPSDSSDVPLESVKLLVRQWNKLAVIHQPTPRRKGE
jgi:hypothetical protein